ncbi:MAG TPA: WXG100 family type VII secretion target [Aggregatilineales bacterium]|nr:WXG100 family type VII secretion target [Anaerolineales bacterium]HRE46782.1 WXG100 family type VII secretion target [Aggregatilineales bacterium]
MSVDVQIDYEMADEAVKLFANGQQQLNETLQAMEQLANTMEQGALLGDGGDMFAQALRSRLGPRLRKLAAKLGEISKDIKAASADIRAADTKGKQGFKS